MIHKHLDQVRINGDCWEWVGRRSHIGYGYFQVAGSEYRAAHYFWALVWHRWPEMLLHSCDHPWCVNPEHLSEDTQSENEHEYVYKDRCRQGHIFDEDNTYQYLDRRICKACKRIRQLKKRIGRAKSAEPVHLSTEELLREASDDGIEDPMRFDLPVVPVEWAAASRPHPEVVRS